MTNAWVLMTAMPPTLGHKAIIDFASELDVARANVMVNTMPDEPFPMARIWSLKEHYRHNPRVEVMSYNKVIQQVPKAANDQAFWDMWNTLLRQYGFQTGDYIVASETYGIKLAETCGGVFMPYDPSREIVAARATNIRTSTQNEFAYVLPEFQKYLRKTITIFGAESTGKTTLSNALRYALPGEAHRIPEYARPYLETVGNNLDDTVMTQIWKGQRALQRSAGKAAQGYPYIVQDTDLYSTVGYWEFWSPNTVPMQLHWDAYSLKSDLYIITQSNVPFEPDPLRYGGDKREATDEYWIELCETYHLPYVVLQCSEIEGRIAEATAHCKQCFGNPLTYTRIT